MAQTMMFTTPNYGWTNFNYLSYCNQDYTLTNPIPNEAKKYVSLSSRFRASYLTDIPKDMYRFLTSVLLQAIRNNEAEIKTPIFEECSFDAEGWEWKIRVCMNRIFLVIKADVIYPDKYSDVKFENEIPDFIIPIGIKIENFVDGWINTIKNDIDSWAMWEYWNETNYKAEINERKEKLRKQIDLLKATNVLYKKWRKG